jgi:AcrR family transcriptional regulator
MSTTNETTVGLGDVGTSAVPTALSVRLASGDRPDVNRAFLLARRMFLTDGRIDMGSLADQLGIDRTSLFRWVGNRDELLTEVLWSLAAPTLTRADRATNRTGTGRLVDVLGDFVEYLMTASYFRAYLRREPARALRVLTTSAAPIQRRYVAIVEHMLTTEIAQEALEFDLPTHDLAYLLVRTSESFTYADLITGEALSAAHARAALRFMLRHS